MLRTSAHELKSINKREEFEIKFLESKSSEILDIRDHLPFRNLIYKIAANLPDGPKKPKFKIQIEKEYGLIYFIRFIFLLEILKKFWKNILSFLMLATLDAVKKR